MITSARFASCLLVLTTPARATYSIVGADGADSLAGISIASCVGALHLDIAVGMAHGPVGFGAVAAQSYVDPKFRGRDRATEMLRQGKTAGAAVDAITNSRFDEGFSYRQYGIAETGSAGHGSSSKDWSGSNNFDWAGGISGHSITGGMPFSAQGNILTGPGCVSQSAAGFREEPRTRIGSVRRASFLATHMNTTKAQEEECFDLPARLMRALRRGADNGEGDSRCTSKSPPVPVDSAYIRVDLPSGEPWLLISVIDTYPRSAVEVLYEEYLGWRADNPCQGGVGLAAFRANATARGVAKEALRSHEKRAEASLRGRVAALGSSSLVV